MSKSLLVYALMLANLVPVSGLESPACGETGRNFDEKTSIFAIITPLHERKPKGKVGFRNRGAT